MGVIFLGGGNKKERGVVWMFSLDWALFRYYYQEIDGGIYKRNTRYACRMVGSLNYLTENSNIVPKFSNNLRMANLIS